MTLERWLNSIVETLLGPSRLYPHEPRCHGWYIDWAKDELVIERFDHRVRRVPFGLCYRFTASKADAVRRLADDIDAALAPDPPRFRRYPPRRPERKPLRSYAAGSLQGTMFTT